ncbi:MAG: hypothetical protein WCO82_08465 [Sphingomonadales bacterium]|jgi:hypothetical protein
MWRAAHWLAWALVGVAKAMALLLFISDAGAWPDALAWLMLAWGLVAAALWLRGRALG